jgi:murein DD-endopeptidase MepM/ murein hydrolase activator NlpD
MRTNSNRVWPFADQFATVQYGEYVREGQMVGLMGSSGFTLMPHLHFEVWPFCDINCPYGAWVDPWSGSANSIPSL